MSYIKRAPLLQIAQKLQGDAFGAPLIVKAIKDAPAADVVEVVRCKDCIYRDDPENTCGNIYCRLHDGRFDKDGYCSYGKKENEQ